MGNIKYVLYGVGTLVVVGYGWHIKGKEEEGSGGEGESGNKIGEEGESLSSRE